VRPAGGAALTLSRRLRAAAAALLGAAAGWAVLAWCRLAQNAAPRRPG
jgi:hypothetical protein